MKYCDLHSDALTTKAAPQVTKETLLQGGCCLQCLAAFVSSKDKFGEAVSLAEKFVRFCEKNGLNPVTNAGEMKEGVNALFTIEDGGAIAGSLDNLATLYSLGARMMTLTWNYPNEIGFPNFPDYRGLLAGKRTLKERETRLGLTPFGLCTVEFMDEIGMIADVSHGSDRLVKDVAACSKKPFVASHSGAQSVCDCARNLTDEGIRLIAESGGVVGLDFCADFTSENQTPEGQKEALLAHAKAIVNAGGEDALAIGSDFDGIPENPYLKNPSCMPAFLEELIKAFGGRTAEKFAYQNFLRVFKEVCG